MKFNITPNGNLEILTESAADIESLRESLESTYHKDFGFLADLLDSITGWMPNGRLYQVLPESIGALTDAPILSDEVNYADNGDQIVAGAVWWFPNYQVESFAETLINTGRVLFCKA